MKLQKCLILVVLTMLLLVLNVSAQSTESVLQVIKAMNLKGVTITKVEKVLAGNYTQPDGKKITNLPAFIRVAFTSRPTTQSNIRCEVWMPIENWNGRFLGTGNGGGAGWISYGPLQSGLRRGFATANTDMGTSPGVDQIVDYPERWADFGYRATHEMTVISKAILQVYYKKHAKYSYFVGCSTGGQQALMEAQRFPDDYNGIIAGAPANNRTHLHASFVWDLKANNTGHDKAIISQKKMELFSSLVLKNCAGKDGGAPGDNFLTDPMVCPFDIETLRKCPDGISTDSCFSTEEITALKKIYAGATNPRTGERIYSPLPLGGTRLDSNSPHFYFFKWVFGKEFDYTKFDFDRDMEKTDSMLAPILNANNPNLKQMKKHGGKILMYTGTADQLVPAPDAINYYERVIEAQGGLKQTQDFFRFFLVPGMSHCGGGPGLNDFGQGLSVNSNPDSEHDILTALQNWVEKGNAPDKFIATTFNCCDSINKIRLQRPIYPYPLLPNYIGGNQNDPNNYRGIHHNKYEIKKPSEKYLK